MIFFYSVLDDIKQVFSNKTFVIISLMISFFSMSKVIRLVVMGWFIYDVTGDPLHLGWLAFAEAICYIMTNPFGGYLADKYGRVRQTHFLSFFVSLLTVWLCYLVSQPMTSSLLFQIYLNAGLFGVVRGAFASGALSTLLTLSVSKYYYHKTNAWSGTIGQLGLVIGPILGGILYHHHGVVVANIASLILVIIAWIGNIFLKDIQVEKQDGEDTIFNQLTAGFRFIFKQPILRATVWLDFIAVVFSGVAGLLPVFAKDILHLGPDGLGYLRSSIQLGAIIAGLFLANYHLKNYIGRQFMIAVFIFCVSILIFAYSTSYILSLCMLFISGFVDWYGAIIRQTLMRHLTPEPVLGRVTAARTLFAQSANEISSFESGLAAGLIGTIPSVVFGVVVTFFATAFVWWKVPSIKDINMKELLEKS